MDTANLLKVSWLQRASRRAARFGEGAAAIGAAPRSFWAGLGPRRRAGIAAGVRAAFPMLYPAAQEVAMDRAVDGSGKDVRSWDFTHAEAKGKRFLCYDCKVPLDVVKMPNYSPPPGGGRPSKLASEIYFRKRRTDPHRDDCDIRQAEVAAIIEKRVVRSRSGPSGAPPSAIVFDREEVRAAEGRSADGDDAEPDLATRYRHVPGGDELPQRGDRKSVSSRIERACLLHLGDLVELEHPLTVQYLPPGVSTYGEVFQRAARAQPDTKRIWFAKLRYKIAPVVSGTTLRLATFGREFLVDRSKWRPSVIADFDDELAVCLAHVRKEWPSANGMIDPFIYALGEVERATGPVVVRDHRMVCIAVRDRR